MPESVVRGRRRKLKRVLTPPVSSAQWKTPEFYWRGGPKLEEPEYVNDAFIRAASEYVDLDDRRTVVEGELAKAQGERADLGATSDVIKLGDAICERQARFDELHGEIEERRKYSCGMPSLQSDLASRIEKVAALSRVLGEQKVELTARKEEFLRKLLSAEYTQRAAAAVETASAEEGAAWLRRELQKLKRVFDDQKPLVPSYAPVARAARAQLLRLVPAQQHVEDMKLQKGMLPSQLRRYRQEMLAQIDELAAALDLFGCDFDRARIAELHKECE